MRDTAFGGWFPGVSLIIALSLAISSPARAESLDPGLIPKIQAATFEVVSAKPETDPLTYERPLPLDQLPYQERTDKFHGIGTAFSIGGNRYVTAAHVLNVVLGGLWGPPALRDATGHVHEIGKIEKYSLDRDFVVFSLGTPLDGPTLETNAAPALNSVVFAVGNALGKGVVIRDGLYTSTTPEDQDGRWNFIRFSAAASPGNSGGPLLDKDGKVIGVILQKSESENLNLALPIAEVLNAPDHLAEANLHASFHMSISNTDLAGTFKMQFALPLTLEDFNREKQAHYDAFIDSEFKALLAQNPDTLFPNGPGSQRMLYSVSGGSSFPVLFTRDGEGNWTPQAKPGPRSPLPGNGYVQGGEINANVTFRWHRPDGVSARESYSAPDKLMGDLLQSGFLGRQVGSERIKVTALGKPSEDSIQTDRWQRHWQLRVWPLAYLNADMITLALPVPDGYVVLLQLVEANKLHEHVTGIEASADFVNVSYEGTLAQWRDFLDTKSLTPPVFDGLKLGFSPGGAFDYASARLSFSVPQDAQATTPGSILTVGMSFFPGRDKPVWDASLIRLRRNATDADLITVQRHIKPTASLGNSFDTQWDKIANRKHPLDEVARVENDISKIAAVVEAPKGADPLYTLFQEIPGSIPQDTIKTKLDTILRTFQITEH